MATFRTPIDRRKFLKRATAAGTGVAITAAAGCLDDGEDEEELDDEEEAGEPLPEFTYFNNPEDYNPGRHDTINLIADRWTDEVGINVEVEVLEWGTLFSTVNDEYDYDLATWSQFPGVDIAENVAERFTSAHADEPGTGNHMGYQDEEMDELIATQQRTEEMDERVEAVHEIQEKIAEDVPFHPILYEAELMPHKNDQVDGWVDHIEGYNRLPNYVNVEVLDENEDGFLRGFWTEALENLNPWAHQGLSKHVHLMDALFEKPIHMTPELEVDEELSLVDDIERPDAETIVWEIKEDASWSDGEPLTAEDVAFTYQTIVDEAPSQYSLQASEVAGAEVIDEYTVQIDLNTEFGLAANGVIGHPIYITPEHVWEGVDLPQEELEEEPVSSGIVEVDYWDPGQEVNLVARDDHRLDFEIEGINWEIITSSSTIWELTDRGEINYHPFAQPSRELSEAHEEDDTLSVAEVEGSGWTHLNINTRNEGLDEQAVRQALAHGIPKETISEQLYYGYYPPGHSYVSPSFDELHNPDVEGIYTGDVEEAHETLREGGFVITDEGVHYAD